MSFIKKRLQKNEKPLQQLFKRYYKIDNSNILRSEHSTNNKTYICKFLHSNGPIPDNFDVQF